jgi:hypothetical protein
MALSTIDDLCCRKGGKLQIVVQGNDPEEVTSQSAKTLAMEKAAQCGYVHTGYNGHSGSYPVDEAGNVYDTDEKIAELTNLMREGKARIAGYRNDIFLMPRL